MIENSYKVTEEMLLHFYGLVSKEYFQRFRKAMFVITAVMVAMFFLMPVHSFKNIFFGMMVALIILDLLFPKMRRNKIKADVKYVMDNYIKMYGDLPEQRLVIKKKTLKVYTNGKESSTFPLGDLVSVRNDDVMIAFEFPESSLLPLLNDGYVQGSAKDVMALVKSEGFTIAK